MNTKKISELRCLSIKNGKRCNKKLGELIEQKKIELHIKCPRCKHINQFIQNI